MADRKMYDGWLHATCHGRGKWYLTDKELGKTYGPFTSIAACRHYCRENNYGMVGPK